MKMPYTLRPKPIIGCGVSPQLNWGTSSKLRVSGGQGLWGFKIRLWMRGVAEVRYHKG